MSALLALLSSRERALQQANIRQDAVALAALLHPEFTEVGRSGLRYDLAEVLRHLPQEAPRELVSEAFSLSCVSENVALLSYCSRERQSDGVWGKHTLRTSLWQNVNGVWLLRFHQGTPQAR
ncbi:DUF4440 domain-containing protein [Neisseriaceae bacterium CLB008]|nr:nuclear transport factor 2 family protein [Neisseriaceae bacterium]